MTGHSQNILLVDPQSSECFPWLPGSGLGQIQTLDDFNAEPADRAFAGWTSVIIMVGSDASGSLLDTPVADWNSAVTVKLGKVLRAAQTAAARMQTARGRITLVWAEDDGGATIRHALAGGCTGMVKALCLDFAPHHIGINGLAVDLARQPQDRDIRACLDLLASRAAEGVVGQVLQPASSTSITGWGSW